MSVGGCGEHLGDAFSVPHLTSGEGLDMPVVCNKMWAARWALTHSAPFPLWGWLSGAARPPAKAELVLPPLFES